MTYVVRTASRCRNAGTLRQAVLGDPLVRWARVFEHGSSLLVLWRGTSDNVESNVRANLPRHITVHQCLNVDRRSIPMAIEPALLDAALALLALGGSHEDAVEILLRDEP